MTGSRAYGARSSTEGGLEAERALEPLQWKEPCVFITGRAGTGKSYLLRKFARETCKQIVLFGDPFQLAPVLSREDEARFMDAVARQALLPGTEGRAPAGG